MGCQTYWNIVSPCCAKTYVTHRKLTGGASGGTLVWNADRGGINGVTSPGVALPPVQSAICRCIRVSGTKVYTCGDRATDNFEFPGGTDPNTYSKSIYTVRTPLRGNPATYTITIDPSAGGAWQVGVASVDNSGNPIGQGDTFALPPTATATDVLNAINACRNGSLSGGAQFVTPGDYTVTGGPLPLAPIVVTPSGRLAGTRSAVSATIQQITSDFRNSVEAWDTSNGANLWKTSLIGISNPKLLVDSDNNDLIVLQQPFNYLTPAYVTDPATAVLSQYTKWTLTCWTGNPPSPVPDTQVHPQPSGGYFQLRLQYTDPATEDHSVTGPLPISVTASSLQATLRALPSAAHGAGQITCTGGPLPGNTIAITLPTLAAGQAWQLCEGTDTLIGPFQSGVSIKRLSSIDGTDQATDEAYGQTGSGFGWGQMVSPTTVVKNGSTVYVCGPLFGADPSSEGLLFPGCQGTAGYARKYDTSLSPQGDVIGGNLGQSPTSIVFDSSGRCYSASLSGLTRISADFQHVDYTFSGTSGVGGAVALLSDSVVVGAWDNKIGTFSTSDGSQIASISIPDTAGGGTGSVCRELATDSNGMIYAAVVSRGTNSPLPGCVYCLDSNLNIQWRFDHQSADGTQGTVFTVCCAPDGSAVYFGGSRIPK